MILCPVSYTHLDVYKRQPMEAIFSENGFKYNWHDVREWNHSTTAEAEPD